MKLTLKNSQIIITCNDPVEYWDVSILVQKVLKNYVEDHHYDEND